MLISSPDKLRQLSAQEQLKRSYEDTDKQLERYRFSDHYDLQDWFKRSGKLMSHTELIQRIEKVTHRRVWAEQSNTTDSVMGFYTNSGSREKRYLCAFEKGYLPEFSLLEVDRADLPVKEKRGWRTVLTRLVQQKALSWAEMKQAFGDTSHVASDRWRFNTRDFRN